MGFPSGSSIWIWLPAGPTFRLFLKGKPAFFNDLVSDAIHVPHEPVLCGARVSSHFFVWVTVAISDPHSRPSSAHRLPAASMAWTSPPLSTCAAESIQSNPLQNLGLWRGKQTREPRHAS